MASSRARIAALATAVCAAASGCATWSGPDEPFAAPIPSSVRPPPRQEAEPPVRVLPAAFQETTSTNQNATPNVPAVPPPLPLDTLATLTAENVVQVVLQRNPTLDLMRATAAVAAARYPQVTSLDDPTLGFTTAPASTWSNNVNYAARVEVSQKFLYPGKRDLKGSAANQETAAATEDIEDSRLQLAESARSGFTEYYLAVKRSQVVEENAKLLQEIHQNAEVRYKNGQGQQQDVFQAEVELARQDERLLSLRRARQVAIARLNTLMHLPPDNPLPPPSDLTISDPLTDVARLRERAQWRPDLQAAAARVKAEESVLALAKKEYLPDVELFTAYDGFWQGPGGPPLQWQVGLRTNLPVRYARRNGAVAEAEAKVAQRRAELARLTDQVNYQVQEAFEQVREAEDIVKLYDTKVLKTAQANVKEAMTGYANNRVAFLNLVEAQRNQTMLKERYYEALAEATRRRAALERAIGVPLAAPGH